MNKKEALKIYNEQNMKMNAYSLVLSTTFYDKSTVAPKKGSDYRNKMLSIMAGEAYSIATDSKFIEAVQTLSKYDLGEEKNRDVSLAKKSLESTLKFTKEEAMEFSMACMEGEDNWEKAKHGSDYSIFEPYLLRLIDLSKKRAVKRNEQIQPYDVYLDDYEEGMNIEKYDEFFKLVKSELLPLIQKVAAKSDEIDDSFLYKRYPAAKQEKFMKNCLNKFLRFDKGWSYMGVSEHPFTDGLSGNDVRITTAYNENNITSCLFSIIHEVGHSYYEHQVASKYEGTNIKHCISSGMHESQSRFLENYLGRRESFWVTLYPKLQKAFPANLKDVTLQQFIKAVNVSKPSLIRTDADELTYPIHILIRYEIEKGIFDGSISTENLDKIWNQKYKEYLGIDVDSDRNGILQDIHWSDASFGYFPTYALGSAVGAQLLNKMEKEIDVDALLAKGNFKAVTDYLKNNFQKYGALYDLNTLLVKVTGEPFNPTYYIDYLKNKYSELYNL